MEAGAGRMGAMGKRRQTRRLDVLERLTAPVMQRLWFWRVAQSVFPAGDEDPRKVLLSLSEPDPASAVVPRQAYGPASASSRSMAAKAAVRRFSSAAV